MLINACMPEARNRSKADTRTVPNIVRHLWSTCCLDLATRLEQGVGLPTHFSRPAFSDSALLHYLSVDKCQKYNSTLEIFIPIADRPVASTCFTMQTRGSSNGPTWAGMQRELFSGPNYADIFFPLPQWSINSVY